MILVAGWYLKKKSALLRALGQLESERHIKFFCLHYVISSRIVWMNIKTGESAKTM